MSSSSLSLVPSSPTARRRGGAQGTATSSDIDSIALFLKSHPGCTDANQITRFLSLIKQGKLAGIDVTAIVRTLYRGGTIARNTSGSGSRSAGMTFSPGTLGVRGAGQTKEMPSLLWEIVETQCDSLPDLSAGLESILAREYGITLPRTQVLVAPATDADHAKWNKDVARFVAAYPRCQQKQQQIEQFLHLVDSKTLKGEDLLALSRVAGLEGVLPTIYTNPKGARVAKMSLDPQTTGLRGVAKTQVKASLLWNILEKYCGSLDAYLNWLTNVLSGTIQLRQQGNQTPLAVVAQNTSSSSSSSSSYVTPH